MEALQDKCCCAVEPKDIVGQNIKDVSSNGSARSHPQTQYAIVDKHILSDDAQGKVTASISPAKECAPVAVDEKQLYITSVVHPQVRVEHKLSQVCTQLDGPIARPDSCCEWGKAVVAPRAETGVYVNIFPMGT